MTIFNPENKKDLNVGECLDPIFKITDRKDAKQYKASYVAYIQEHLDKEPGNMDKSAMNIANSNIGYYAGYGSNEDRKRIEELFDCAHPIFGSIKEKGAPTSAEAFEMGKELSKKKK